MVGNEADYVIVSVTRTGSPGFLKSRNRVNVMLTRCKKGMVIVAKRAFVIGRARKTLLGELAAHWEKRYGKEESWTDWRAVANGKAIVPGSSVNVSRGESEKGLVDRLASLSIAVA